MTEVEYDIVVIKEDVYVATCKEIPSISGIGDTPTEAINEFKEAMQVAKEIMKEQSTPLPQRGVVHKNWDTEYEERIVYIH